MGWKRRARGVESRLYRVRDDAICAAKESEPELYARRCTYAARTSRVGCRAMAP